MRVSKKKTKSSQIPPFQRKQLYFVMCPSLHVWMWCRHFDENQVWVLLPKALFEEPESGEEALRERDPQKHSSRTLGVPK